MDLRKARAKVRDRTNGSEVKFRDLCATVRELAADLGGFRREMDERDKRYVQSFSDSKESVAAALASIKEQTAAAFLSSERAKEKAERGQDQYNATHNDLTRKMDGQYAVMMPRTEAVALIASAIGKVEDLKAALSEHVIVDQASHATAMPRLEAISALKGFEAKTDSLEMKLSDLRESRSVDEGKEQQHVKGVTQAQWLVTTAIAVFAVIVGLFVGMISLVNYIGPHVKVTP